MGNSEKYEDKTLTCADCNKEFTWSASEQEFFAEKKFTPPKRCLDCRAKRRKEKKGRRSSSRPSTRGNSR
ncbi:hypothetical protein LCGC14_0399760 [marine sediment metagenome]|uniref:Probable zinc-binding domain-containing protein n=1 Tax=marine sediment metagenome TaxID=412755 RepID=A0A0F9T2R9_9ZZZZ